MTIDWAKQDKIELMHAQIIADYTGFDIQEQTKGYNPYYDVIINNKKIEIKTDFQANYTNNICIEFKNTNQNKPSGIEITKSSIWSNTYYYDNQWYIGLCKVNDLKQLIKDNDFYIVKNNKSGDNNSLLYLINCKIYHELCNINIKIKSPTIW